MMGFRVWSVSEALLLRGCHGLEVCSSEWVVFTFYHSFFTIKQFFNYDCY